MGLPKLPVCSRVRGLQRYQSVCGKKSTDKYESTCTEASRELTVAETVAVGAVAVVVMVGFVIISAPNAARSLFGGGLLGLGARLLKGGLEGDRGA